MKSKKFKIGLTWGLILIVAFTLLLIITNNAEAKTWYVDDSGGADYEKIQDAINATEDGDTVFVYEGTYYENVIVNNMINLTGESNEKVTISAGGSGDVVRIETDWVNMSGFSVINGDDDGIEIVGSANNRIFENNITNNSWGFYFGGFSEYNTFVNNIISNNHHDGIGLWKSSYNILSNNTISNNNEGGIHLSGSSEYNTLSNNTISNNNEDGIYIDESSYNTLLNNNISNNKEDGIHISDTSDKNTIHHNIFINNVNNAFDENSNYWNDSSEGNYWDDYSGIDENKDGIGDTPYNIPGGGNKDSYPFSREKNTWYVDDDGGKDFTNIQDAIDFAKAGDTVYVYTGTYYENVVVDVSITLEGEDRDTTIIDGGDSGVVVTITKDWVNMSGFMVTNSGSSGGDAGIKVTSNYNKIFENNCSNNNDGISLYDSNNNTLINNNVSNNDYGISLGSSNNNKILDNINIINSFNGIHLHYSSRNILANNKASNNDGGIHLTESSNNNTIRNNTVYSNNFNGIILHECFNNTLTDNNFLNNSGGISLDKSSNNKLINNTANSNNFCGIRVTESNNNIISDCNISNNGNGIDISDSSNKNTIHHNYFINNEKNANDEGSNYWDDDTDDTGDGEGNYWDDYSGIDANEDGIGDTPYEIPGGDNQDRYPFMGEGKKTLFVDDDGGQDFEKIQDAIDAAGDGDTVYVYAGTYYENVEVDKSINLEGEDMDTTIIDGGGNADTVLITAGWVNLCNFSIRNSGFEWWGDSGIGIGSEKNNIYNNNIFENVNGVYFYEASNNKLWNNNIKNNGNGIVLHESLNNEVIDNNISNNDDIAILMDKSNNSKIENNIIFENDVGIHISDESGTTVLRNTIQNNFDAGIRIISSSKKILIEDNKISSIYNPESGGIDCYESPNIIITDNTFLRIGIWVQNITNIEISNNQFINQTHIDVIGLNSNILMENNQFSHENPNYIGRLLNAWFVQIQIANGENEPIGGVQVNYEDPIIELFELFFNIPGGVYFTKEDGYVYSNLWSQFGFGNLNALTEYIIDEIGEKVSYDSHKFKAKIGDTVVETTETIDRNRIDDDEIVLTIDEYVPPLVESAYTENVPTIDGIINPDEWDDATKISKEFISMYDSNNSFSETHMMDAFFKNDVENLYIAITISDDDYNNSEEDFDLICINFDDPHDGVFNEGEDWKLLSTSPVYENYYDENQRINTPLNSENDDDQGGSQDGIGAIRYQSGFYYGEVTIPLNSGDNLDIQTTVGDVIGFNIVFVDHYYLVDEILSVGGWPFLNPDNATYWGDLKLGTPPPPPQPDFTLTESDITFIDNEGKNITEPIEGERIGIEAVIQNIGNLNGSAKVKFYDGEPNGNNLIYEKEINVDKESNYSVQYVWIATIGEHDIYVVISESNPEESNTENNQAHRIINILQPDLTVLNITVKDKDGKEFSELIEGTNYTIEVTIQNKGKVKATATIKFYYEFLGENIKIGEGNITVEKNSSITLPIEWIAIEGKHDIIVVISNTIPEESNKENNQASKSIDVVGKEDDDNGGFIPGFESTFTAISFIGVGALVAFFRRRNGVREI